MLAKIEVFCNDQMHHISAWKPGDEEKCGSEHVTYGPKGHIICYEDHEVELEQTIADLTGEKTECFKCVDSRNVENMLDAAQYGKFDLVIISICLGIDIHAEKDYAIREATQSGHLRAVQLLVDNGADVNTSDDYPLRWASWNGHLSIVKFLIEHGADVHSIDDGALRLAAENGKLNVVKLLVKHGANIHAREDSALAEATRTGRKDVVAYLKKKIAEEKLRGTP
jgi:ankyrin repeat protein